MTTYFKKSKIISKKDATNDFPSLITLLSMGGQCSLAARDHTSPKPLPVKPTKKIGVWLKP